MKISVVGLGVEGQKATISLLKRGFNVYSSDINRKINLAHLNNIDADKESGTLDLEIGSHNLDKILKSDVVAVSPSLFNKDITKKIIEQKIFISDVMNKHKDIKTIAVTGTNGKTTTSHMIYHILKSAGYNVALGGNGGGGFSGYIDLLLDANSNDYDYLVIEVCDMTLKFCDYVFNIDIVVTTNIGYDHMDVHKSIENYTSEVAEFINDKIAILNSNDKNLMKITSYPREYTTFDLYQHQLKLFGKFNLQNADAARVCAIRLGISDEEVIKSLQSFNAVEGRTEKIKYASNDIVTGKTDNVDAIKVVLDEEHFDILFIGTPRENETFRYNILDYVIEYKADTLIIFPGLDDITYSYMQYLNDKGYNGDVMVIKEIKDIITFINNQKNKKIFIGGNGQDKISKINQILTK